LAEWQLHHSAKVAALVFNKTDERLLTNLRRLLALYNAAGKPSQAALVKSDLSEILGDKPQQPWLKLMNQAISLEERGDFRNSDRYTAAI